MRKNLIAWMKSSDFKKYKSDFILCEIGDKEDSPVYRRLRGYIDIRVLKREASFLDSIVVDLDSDSSREVYNYNMHHNDGWVTTPRIFKKDLFVILDSNKFLEVE
jgi:hypothetical protein